MRILTMLALLSLPAYAQKPAANPLSSTLKGSWDRVSKFLAGSAELMAPADYAFKPTPEVRSFAQIIGHVADASYHICSTAKGEPSPSKSSAEKTATTKPDLVKAVNEALAYCDAVFASVTDASLSEPREIFGRKTNKLGVLQVQLGHANEHYGMLVTYLRMKKLVPPSSAQK